MTATITIQPGQPGQGMGYDPLLPLPYPFHIVAATGDCVHGRGTPEFERIARPWRLLGFQANGVQTVALWFEDFVKDPQRAVGMQPVFVDAAAMFTLTTPITDVTVNTPTMSAEQRAAALDILDRAGSLD